MARPIRAAVVLLAILLAAGSCSRKVIAPRLESSTGGSISPTAELSTADRATMKRVGATIDPSGRVYLGDNAAPMAEIIDPIPTPLVEAWLSSSSAIHWRGTDPDGPGGAPTSYRIRFVRDDDPDYALFFADADSIGRRDGPRFANWDSVGPGVHERGLDGLTAHRAYLFAIVAFDDKGGYTPLFSLSQNLLWFRIVTPELCGPSIGIANEYFSIPQCLGCGYPLGPGPSVVYHFPSQVPISFHWRAVAISPRTVHSFRWALAEGFSPDPGSVAWSPWSADTVASLGTFDQPGQHTFLVQALDSQGCVGIVRVAFDLTEPPGGWRVLPVRIVDPVPEHVAPVQVPAGVVVTWTVPEDVRPRVSQFRFRLFDASEALAYRDDPDSIGRRYGPTFESWSTLSADARQIGFPGLQVDRRYLFAIVAEDGSGHVTSPISWDNILWFEVTPPQHCGSGPLSVWTPYFYKRTPAGGAFPAGGGWNAAVSLPSHTEIPIHWYGEPIPYRRVSSYRWAFQKVDSDHHEPREPHWSRWSLADSTDRLHPLQPTDPNERYLIQVQAQNSWGCVTEMDIYARVEDKSGK